MDVRIFTVFEVDENRKWTNYLKIEVLSESIASKDFQQLANCSNG